MSKVEFAVIAILAVSFLLTVADYYMVRKKLKK